MSEEDDNDRPLTGVAGGVNTVWLARAFRLNKTTVQRRLAALAPIAQNSRNEPLYDLPEAASYLVKPRNLDHILKTMKPADLPDSLRESFWNAKLKEQSFRVKAGEYWSTDDVIGVFSGVLKNIRERLQIVPDTAARSMGLEPAQVKSLTEIMDSAQDSIHQEILTLGARSKTPNTLINDKDVDLSSTSHRNDEDII
jgi:hypothetical protein